MSKKAKITILIIFLVAAMAVGGSLLVQAIWSNETAIHIDATSIEDSTLIIGTHLIHISALNDSLYEIAQESAEDSNQYSIYYKSELAEGAWFDITSARTLADISTDGTKVENSVVEELYMEYHTKSDGITYDLRTGESVCIFDIYDPYGLADLPELEPLKYQYELLCEKEDKNDVEDWCEGHIRALFSTDFTMETAVYEDDITGEEITVDGSDLNTLDENLAMLQWFLDTQNERDMDADHTGATMDVMSAVDAQRRLITMRILHEKTFEMQNVWMGTSTITSRPEDYVVSVELTDAISSSLDNISESTIEYTGKILSEGTTSISYQQYQWRTQLVDDSYNELQDDCDYDIEQLLILEALLYGDGSLTEDATELIESMIDDLLELLEEYLSEGETVAYETAVANGETDTYLSTLEEAFGDTITELLAEVFYLEESLADTMSTDDATEYLADCITELGDLYNAIADDDFADTANSALDSLLDQLTDALSDVISADNSTEVDLLYLELTDLQTEYMECLDNNDLEGAAEIKEEIEALADEISELIAAQTDAYAQVQSEISDLEDQIAATTDPTELSVLNDQLASKEAEAALLEAQMSDTDISSRIIELRDSALDAIENGESETITACLSALDSLMDGNYSLVFPAVQVIYEALLADEELSGYSNSYSAGYLDGSAASSGDGSGDGTDDGSGDGTDDGSGDGTDDGSGDGTDDGSGDGTDDGSGDSSASGTYVYADQIDQCEDIILNNNGAYLDALAGKVTADNAMDAISSVLDVDPTMSISELMDALDNFGEASVLGALGEYLAVHDNTNLQTMMTSIANQAYIAGNPLVYNRVEDITTEFLPLDSLSYVTGYRYYWNNTISAGVLAKGTAYFAFSSRYDVVSLSEKGGETTKMSKPSAVLNKSIHIPEDFSAEYFACQCAYLPGTPYGVAIPDSIRPDVDEILEMLFQGGF